MRVVTVVQARTSSTRLPGKVLRPIAGRAVLLRQLDRMQRADLVGTIVVATSTDRSDDPIEALCNAEGVPVVRGALDDLLDRHMTAARAFAADAVVKIPSDVPLIDPAVIDLVIGTFLEGAFDFVSNLHPPSWPDGQDVEVMAMDVFTEAWEHATLPLEREHTTPYVWERPDRFRIGNVSWKRGVDYSMSHRWTLDYEEDFRFIQAVFEALGPDSAFSVDEVLALLDAHPELSEINARYAGVNWYRHHLDELSTVHSSSTRPAPEEHT